MTAIFAPRKRVMFQQLRSFTFSKRHRISPSSGTIDLAASLGHLPQMPLLAWLCKDFMYAGRRFWGTLVSLLASAFKPAWGRGLRSCQPNRFNRKSKK